jgi:hypothetical protein
MFPHTSRARALPGRACTAAVLAGIVLAACDSKAKTPIEPDPAALSCERAGIVRAGDREIPVAPGGFAAVGNRIIRASDCAPYRFAGVSRPTLSFSSTGGRLNNPALAAHDFANIRAWKANTVRIELAQYYWVPTARSYDAGYAARVERVVKQARDAGLNVILVLQASDRGIADYEPVGNTHQPMPDRNHSIPFWRDVASRFKNDGGVLYELYSEPFPLGGKDGFSDWNMWLKGGLHRADDVYGPRPAFQAVGMQELYDVVRSTGAHNLVVIGGTKWGYYLDGVPANRVNGYNIAYSTHPWSFAEYPDVNQPATWDRDWAFLAKTDPVMITEFGQFDCGENYVRALLDKADALGLSWTAWMWGAPAPGETVAQSSPGDPVCARSYLVLDWDGTPSRTGSVIRERLGRY